MVSDQGFQTSFRYGRVNLGFRYIVDVANFFIRVNKVLYVNREKFDKI